MPQNRAMVTCRTNVSHTTTCQPCSNGLYAATVYESLSTRAVRCIAHLLQRHWHRNWKLTHLEACGVLANAVAHRPQLLQIMTGYKRYKPAVQYIMNHTAQQHSLGCT